MRVAAYRAPLRDASVDDALELVRRRVTHCEQHGVAILCCPEALLGGLADARTDPRRFAVATGRIGAVLTPLTSDTVTTIIGFTELAPDGRLYNSAAVWHRGTVAGVYRKRHPAIRHSVYAAGTTTPVFRVAGLTLGIVICYDSTFAEPAASMAAQGATAIFVPTNNGLPPRRGAGVVAEARHTDITRARESGVWVVRADVAGRIAGLASAGSSAIVRPDGSVAVAGPAFVEDLLVAELGGSGA